MEMIKTTGFAELSADEMNEVDGGVDPVSAATAAAAIVTVIGGAAYWGWNAGRGLIRDIRNKWF